MQTYKSFVMYNFDMIGHTEICYFIQFIINMHTLSIC